MGVSVDRYLFTVTDFHHLPPAGLPRRTAAQYLARGLPCERFTAALASRTSCITRGRGGWLDLPRGGLSPPILCQLPGALRDGSNSEVGGRNREVRLTPESKLNSDIPACLKGANFRNDQRLFNQLVGAQDEVRRDFEADFFCGFQIDDKLEPARLFNRNIGRACPAQYLDELPTQQMIQISEARPIADQTTLFR